MCFFGQTILSKSKNQDGEKTVQDVGLSAGHQTVNIIQTLSGVPLPPWQVWSFCLLLHCLPLHRGALPHNCQVKNVKEQGGFIGL